MSSEAKSPEEATTVKVVAEKSTPAVEVKMESGPLATVPNLPESSSEWQKSLDQVLEYASLDVLVGFFNTYRQPLTTLGIIIAGLVSLKVALAIVSALNEIPLLSPTFEGIGIGYTGWFIYRYLLKASNRSELSKDFEVFKKEIMGGK